MERDCTPLFIRKILKRKRAIRTAKYNNPDDLLFFKRRSGVNAVWILPAQKLTCPIRQITLFYGINDANCSTTVKEAHENPCRQIAAVADEYG